MPFSPISSRRFPRRERRLQSFRAITETLEPRRLFDGLTGQYFNRVDHTELVTTRTDATVDFTWSGSPAAGVNADKFSARWTGQVQAPSTRVYTFTTTADDGVRLWVDGRLLIDNWVNQGNTERSGQISLEGGKRYDIRLDYYDFNQNARINLAWSSPVMAQETVPATALFASPSGLSATFYNGTDFTQPAARRTDPTINFNWLTGQPDPSITADGFSARWTGYIVPEFSETYSFFANTVGSAAVSRVKIDGTTVVDASSSQDWNRVRLEAGKRHAITIEYADPSGSAGLSLLWSSPSRSVQLVPASRFFSGAATSVPTRRVNYTNPITTFDAPDPGLIKADGAYWMVHTMGGPDIGWPLWKSLDGVNFTFQKHLLTTANKRPWMSGQFWAPEIHKVGNNFVLTGTSTDSRTGKLTIVMASSPTIDGTYTLRTEPIVSTSVSVLDSNIFTDDDGRNYLLWKRDSATQGGFRGTIRIRELDATGLNFASGSSEVVLLDNETGGWENFLAEAPWLVRRDDAYYLFYSANTFDGAYALGVARGGSLTSMFTRNPANPIISNNATWIRPGHGAFVQDLDGTLWHQYHAYRASNVAGGRVQVLDPVVWSASGWPTFENNSVSTTAKPGPRVAAVQGAGVVAVFGDTVVGAADTIRLVRSGPEQATLDVYVNGALSRSLAFAEVQQLVINSGGGDDTLRLDFTNGDVIPGGGISFAGGAGSGDTIQIVAPPGSTDATFRHLGDGALALGSGLLTSTDVERLRIDGGTHRALAALPAALQMTGGSLTLTQNQTLASLELSGTASVALVTGNRFLRTNSLTLADDARLDLADGSLIVDYAAGASNVATAVAAALRSGRDGGAWTGRGINSSVAAATFGTQLGYADTASVPNYFPSNLPGGPLDNSALYVRFTTAGDVNLDGVTNAADLDVIRGRFGQPADSYFAGDADFDNDVDAADFAIAAGGFAGGPVVLAVPGIASAGTSAVDELTIAVPDAPAGLAISDFGISRNGGAFTSLASSGVTLTRPLPDVATLAGLAAQMTLPGLYRIRVAYVGARTGQPISGTIDYLKYALGDMNLDGFVNNADIAPFVQGLTDPAGFAATNGFAPTLPGDCNLDGVFNNADISSFVALLTGGRPAGPAVRGRSVAPTADTIAAKNRSDADDRSIATEVLA